MVELKEIICKILKTQSENISDGLVAAQKGFPELGLEESDIPEVSIGYGFYHEDHKYNVRVTLEKEFD